MIDNSFLYFLLYGNYFGWWQVVLFEYVMNMEVAGNFLVMFMMFSDVDRDNLRITEIY